MSERGLLLEMLSLLYDSRPLVAVQVDNEQNRAFARRCGAEHIAWPKPYKKSTRGVCVFCDGAIWIGPLIAKLRNERLANDETANVYCLLCAGIIFRPGNNHLQYLSDKKAGE